MTDTTVTIRLDEQSKQSFENFCADVGMNMSVAINLFVKKVIREKRIPFEIASEPRYEDVLRRNRETVEAIRAEAKLNGTSEITLEEINAVIAESRRERAVRGYNEEHCI